MLAGRYLRSRRRETFISVIAGISFAGIMLGAIALWLVFAARLSPARAALLLQAPREDPRQQAFLKIFMSKVMAQKGY